MNETHESLRGAKTVLLRTFKRDGTPVPTPVSIAFGGDRAFFRSHEQAVKSKWLRNNPNVEVAPSTLGGRVTGPTIVARAVLLTDGKANIAAKALAREHRIRQGVLVPLTYRLMGYRTLHYELTPRNGHAE